MKYQANPVIVDAFEIIKVGDWDYRTDTRLCELDLAIEKGRFRHASTEMTARYVPVPGDYWVVQADGYEYVNPKAVFERKYSPWPNVKEPESGSPPSGPIRTSAA